MNFIRATGVQGKKIAPEKRIYATLAVSGEVLINAEELLRFLNQLIALEIPLDGFYVLVAAGNAEARTDLFNAEVTAGWMFLNHVLSVKGFLVINGFSDLLTPFLGAAGAEAGATGWWSNLRTFSLERFSPATSGGRCKRPAALLAAAPAPPAPNSATSPWHARIKLRQLQVFICSHS